MKKSIAHIVSLLLLLILFSCAANVDRAQKGAEDPTLFDSSQIEIAPILIKSVDPKYPPDALAAAITGIVWLKVHLDTLGQVTDAQIVKDSGLNVGFEEAALTAARKTKWKPAISGGKPIATWVTYKVEFNIK